MITNKSDSADTSEKFVTPREKKIGDLAQVLERQRQTIKTLLTTKKEESHNKRDHNVYMQIQNKQKVQTKVQTKVQAKIQTREPEKYQQLCEQILNMGNKLLSGRRPSTLQSYRDANAQVDLRQMHEIREVPQQKAEGGDKEMDYLKSDEYRLYLQNLTKDEDCNSNAVLLKRMKETRNNNAYSKPSPVSKVFKNLEIKSSAREQRSSYRQLRQFREAEIPRKRQMLHNMQPINSGFTAKQRIYDRSSNAFDQIIILPTDSINFKEMLHSPTMKDINKPVSYQNIPKKEEKPSRSVSNNNKIQSRTVDCLVFTGLTPSKSGVKQQSKVQQKKQSQQDSPKLCKYSKQWDSDVYKIDFPSLKNKKIESQFGSKELKRSDSKSSALKQSYFNSNIKKQNYKPETHHVDNKKSKNNYETYQKNIKRKVVILEQSSHQFTDFSELSQLNIEDVNLYELNYKLQDPKMKPQYYQSKTPTKIYKEKTPPKLQKTNDKQNTYFPAKILYSYKQESVKTPKRQTTNKKQKQNIIPYLLDCPYNKKWKLEESQTTSTVTKSACDAQPQLRGHSRSKSKLSVVTASKKQKR